MNSYQHQVLFCFYQTHYCVCVCGGGQGGRGGSFQPPVGFPLESKTVAAFSNILLKTFVPNLVSLISLTRPSLQILGRTQTGVFLISRFLVHPLLTKLDNRKTTTSKNLTILSCPKVVTPL